MVGLVENKEQKFRKVEYSKIGEVQFLKKKGVKRLSISVKPFKGVLVTMPYGISYSDAEKFVLEKMEWIALAKLKMSKLETRKTLFDETTSFATKKRTLAFIRKSTNEGEPSARISSTQIAITLPNNSETCSPAVQELVVKAIEKAWSLEAKEILPLRVNQLALKHGFIYSGVVVKRIKSRWGSCSSANNINLSIYLMQLPDYLIDYVILHELCHTVQKNHGPNFWKLLDSLTDGNAKQFARDMKRFSTRYF